MRIGKLKIQSSKYKIVRSIVFSDKFGATKIFRKMGYNKIYIAEKVNSPYQTCGELIKKRP